MCMNTLKALWILDFIKQWRKTSKILLDYPFVSRRYWSFTTNDFYFWAIIASVFSTYLRNLPKPSSCWDRHWHTNWLLWPSAYARVNKQTTTTLEHYNNWQCQQLIQYTTILTTIILTWFGGLFRCRKCATLASGALHGFNNLLKSSKELNMRLAKYHSLEVKLECLRSNERLLVVGQI